MGWRKGAKRNGGKAGAKQGRDKEIEWEFLK